MAFSTGGIPLLYLGDEVGQLNDYSYTLEDGHDGDSRWVHRPQFPAERYAKRRTRPRLRAQCLQGCGA